MDFHERRKSKYFRQFCCFFSNSFVLKHFNLEKIRSKIKQWAWVVCEKKRLDSMKFTIHFNHVSTHPNIVILISIKCISTDYNTMSLIFSANGRFFCVSERNCSFPPKFPNFKMMREKVSERETDECNKLAYKNLIFFLLAEPYTFLICYSLHASMNNNKMEYVMISRISQSSGCCNRIN